MKYFIPFTIVLLYGCAQQSSLSGGQRDNLPPQVIDENTFPKNKTTLFHSPEIIIAFDEYIKLNNPQKKIVVTPIIYPSPNYKVKGKKLVITLDNNKLSPNTTYTINFSDAISDITEGNKLQGFTYVFSTGKNLDSLQISGTVYDAFTKKTKENIMVGLYPENDSLNEDSLAIITKPYYFTTTTENGKFFIKNIKEGNYHLIAFEDKNNNLKLNPQNEAVAFIDSIITINKENKDSLEPYKLTIFEPAPHKIWVKSKRYKYPGKITLLLNAKANESSIKILNNTLYNDSTTQTFKNKDTLSFWIKNISASDNVKLLVNFNGKTTDTLNIKTKVPKKYTDTLLKATSNTIGNLPYFQPVILTFKTPLKSVDTTKIIFLNTNDSTQLNFTVKIKENKLFIYSDFKEDNNYTATFLPDAIKDLYHLTNDTINLIFGIKSPEEYGNIVLHFKKELPSNYIVMLIKNNEVIKQITIDEPEKNITFNHLIPGKYNLKAIEDNNKNERWDTGNYIKKQQPEKVLFYNETIELKTGWDLDINWIIKPL